MSNIMEFFTSVNTEPMKFIAQIVGIIPLCISYFMFLYTDRKKIDCIMFSKCILGRRVGRFGANRFGVSCTV